MDNFIVKCDLIAGIFLVNSASDFGTMPSDIVSIAVSAGLGVSVLAGILSGVCYILTQRVQAPRRNRKSRRDWYCDVCGAYLRSINGILEGDRVVTCAKCQTRVCKNRCSKLTEATEWICKNCLNSPESWFQTVLATLQLYKTVDDPDTMNTAPLNQQDEDIEVLRKKEKERIREFIEQVVNSLIGGNVDDANVTKIYNDRQYLPIQGQTPCTAHAALKQLIQRLIAESLALPLLQKAQDHPAKPDEESNRTYEDLFATAIINKVVSGAQNRLANSSAASVSSRISSSSRREDKEYFFGEETLDNKWKTTDCETSSFSSVEDCLLTNFGSKKFVDRETLTIKHDIEISQSNSEEEEDDNEYFRSRSSLLGDDEPNWFLQKRHFQTASPVPVPMLVPNPTTEAKVLIGDKEVDETSDLSDIASDYGETEIVPRTQSILVESKTIIGGKNPLHSGSDGESSADSGVKEVDRDRSGYDQPAFISKTDITVDDDNVEDASILSVYSNTEKEAEYTERYASLPRTILKTPTPPARRSLNKEKQNGKPMLETSVAKPKIENNVHTSQETSVNKNEEIDIQDDDDDADTESLFEGSYSKKEKEKWKHAVEMENNPYSKENIERRINRTKSPFDTLFGPDYYARQASLPSGGKSKNNEEDKLVWTVNQINGENHEDYDESWVNADSISVKLPEEETQNEKTVENGSSVAQKSLKTESSSEISISEMTSDSDISCINYYDVEKSQVYKKTPDETIKKTSNNKDPLTENSNSNYEKNKHTYIKVNSVIPTRYNRHTEVVKKRHKSESDLLTEDSFNAPPKVLGQKKDNTLISKIYSQPHVRNFAISSRKQFPTDSLPSLTSPTQSIYEKSRYNGKVALYNSEGEASYERKSLHNSTEDLLDPPPQQNYIRSRSATNNNSSPRKNSVSSEDDALSEHSPTVGLSYKRNSKHQIYSSSDDLFSIDEQDVSHKKKDNTLIDKIYQNLQVRNYGLSTRDYIPVQENTTSLVKKVYSSEDEIKISPTTSENLVLVQEISNKNGGPYGSNYGLHLASELDAETPSGETIQRDISPPDPEIDEIAKKKIVHNLLDKFGEARPEITPRKKVNSDMLELNVSETEVYVSVKELRKKFENKNVKSEVKSSLTARSLSKKIREELKQ